MTRQTTARIAAALTAIGLAGAGAASAQAQEFPADDDWVALECDDQPMTDGVGDEPDAIDELDIVGDLAAPAAARAIDLDFLYLRLRLEADPVDLGGALSPSSWGLAFDLDEDLSTYEALILASGVDQTVALFRNETTTLPDDPTDPADQPPVASWAFVDAGRSAPATSMFGDDADRFLDLAVPWDDLALVDITPRSRVSVWAASSTLGDALDADFACHPGGGGDPSLSDTSSDETTPDPDGDGDGGGGGLGGGDIRPEGGGGCSSSGGDAAGPLAAFALLLVLSTRRRPARRRLPVFDPIDSSSSGDRPEARLEAARGTTCQGRNRGGLREAVVRTS